jgi:hypothetical protein
MIRLAILYERDGAMPLSIAKIRNRQLLLAAARAAIREAEQTACDLASRDAVLGDIQMEEANKLRRVLAPLL